MAATKRALEVQLRTIEFRRAGGRSDQSNVTLDGLDDNDQTNGFAFTGVLRSTIDSTEEFRVTTTNVNASAGCPSGAQVSLITKSGTNKFHGSLYEYNRNTIATANNWFNKQAELREGLPNIPGNSFATPLPQVHIEVRPGRHG